VRSTVLQCRRFAIGRWFPLICQLSQSGSFLLVQQDVRQIA
jgi:hypothetical protein